MRSAAGAIALAAQSPSGSSLMGPSLRRMGPPRDGSPGQLDGSLDRYPGSRGRSLPISPARIFGRAPRCERPLVLAAGERSLGSLPGVPLDVQDRRARTALGCECVSSIAAPALARSHRLDRRPTSRTPPLARYSPCRKLLRVRCHEASSAHAGRMEAPLLGALFHRFGRLGRRLLDGGEGERARLPAQRIHVVRLPADTEALEQVRAPRPSGTFRVYQAGRFTEKKGFDTGIRAFARALRGKNARLLLVGGGELEDLYRAIVRDERIEDQVDWAGRLPFVEYMEAIARCHVGLYPSRVASDGDSEGGAPVTLIEAQWLGIPALISDLDDLPSVAAPGSPLLPPRDVDAWAEAIRAASDSPDEVLPRSAQVSDFARERHSPQANARAREEIYQAVVSG